MTYQLNWEINGVIAHFTGVFDLNTSNSADNEFYFDSRSNDVKFAIWDLSDIERIDFPLSHAEFPAIRDVVCSDRIPGLKFGIIVNDEQSAAFILQYINKSVAMGSPWKFKVAGSIEEIREWIYNPKE